MTGDDLELDDHVETQAFVIGRPPSVSFATVDCKRPFDLGTVSDKPSEAEPVACKPHNIGASD